jgi:hypothetical protein
MNTSEWRKGVFDIHNEAAGLLDVDIIDAVRGADLIGDAIQGDREALTLLRAVAQAATRIKDAPRRTPSLCLCCPRVIRRLTPATIFGVARPSIARPSNALAFAFCDRCSADRGNLAAKTAEGLRRIWPDIRAVEISHPEGGRA